MRKLLRARDKLLIVSAFLGDLVIDTVEAGVAARREGRLSFWRGTAHTGTLSRTVYRLLETGSLEKITKSGQPYLRLTSGGRNCLRRDFPLLRFQQKPWNGFWCVVNYDIPEANKSVRESLREKLISLGFALWQKSVYASPHDFGDDLREWLNSNNLGGWVFVSQARDLVADEVSFAREIFKLDELRERYEELVEKFRKREKEGSEALERVYEEYLSTLLIDPLLPRELLPLDWPEFWLRKKFFKKALSSLV